MLWVAYPPHDTRQFCRLARLLIRVLRRLMIANGVGAGLVPHVKVWVDVDGQVALSDWRIGLLERIDTCGSLAEAARQLNIPYRTAWYKLREMQSALGGRVLVSHSGGASRGGMQLTDRAREAIRRYRCVTDGLDELIAERFASAFSDF